MRIAPGKRSAARGSGFKMNSPFFLVCRAGRRGRPGKIECGCRVSFTQGGGLGGLYLGYYRDAPPGRRTGGPSGVSVGPCCGQAADCAFGRENNRRRVEEVMI